MSDTPATAPAEGTPPPKKKLMLIIIAAVVVVAVGSGGAFFFLKRGKAAETAEEGKKTAKEKKVKHASDDEEDDAAAEEPNEAEKGKEAAGGKAKFSIKRLNLPDDRDVKNVVELQSFVVNLADKGEAHYLRMVVSIGIGESKEEKVSPLLTTRVRNAMLAVLTSKTSDEILTEEGKLTLRKQLLKAARAAVEEPSIEAVYITDFIVQL